jgi:hypothetical protein
MPLQALTPDLGSRVKIFFRGVVYEKFIVFQSLFQPQSGLRSRFAVDLSSTEIPVAGLKAVSNAFVLCIAADVILSALYYSALA